MDRGQGGVGGDSFGCFDAVEAGHADVHEHDVGLGASEQTEGFVAVGSFAHHLMSSSASSRAAKPARTRAWSSTSATLIIGAVR